MRIIAGIAGGHRLISPPTDRIRPTSDRVREALFSMLGPIEGAVVVDGFAGAGTLGLEALSRGAKQCYFFDSSHQAIETVRENARRTGLVDDAIIRQCTFEQGLATVVEGTPDLWLLDPPYKTIRAREALEAMDTQRQKVTPGALVVWESHVDEQPPPLSRFEVTRQRDYGTTRLTFLRCIDEGDDGTTTS